MIDRANGKRIERRIKRLVAEGKIAPAQVDRNPKGHDAEERHGAKHESPMAKPCAQPPVQPQGGDA